MQAGRRITVFVVVVTLLAGQFVASDVVVLLTGAKHQGCMLWLFPVLVVSPSVCLQITFLLLFCC